MATGIRLFSSEPHHNPGSLTLTSIIHEHAEAGRTEEALDVYRRFISAGISPDYYTYNALIMALAADPNYVADAKDCVLHMMTNGIRDHPDVSTYMAVYKGFLKAEEGKQFLKEIKAKGLWGAEEQAVREALKGQTESEVLSVLDILMGECLIN